MPPRKGDGVVAVSILQCIVDHPGWVDEAVAAEIGVTYQRVQAVRYAAGIPAMRVRKLRCTACRRSVTGAHTCTMKGNADALEWPPVDLARGMESIARARIYKRPKRAKG